MDNDYGTGHSEGYRAFKAGAQSKFECRNHPPRVVEVGGPHGDRNVDAWNLDYARGYMDGFELAESDSHD